MANGLWKPQSENTGKVAFLGDEKWGNGNIWLMDADTGALLATGSYDKPYEDGRSIYRFDKSGSSISSKNCILIGPEGQYLWIGDASKRLEGLPANQGKLPVNANKHGEGYTQFDLTAANRTLAASKVSIPDDHQSNYNGIEGVGNVAKPELLDPNLNQLTQITDTKIEFTDPISTLREIAKENRGQVDENVIKAMEYAGKLSDANTQQLIDYLDQMSPYQRQLIGIENAFNQQEQLKAAETAIPGVTDMLRGELKNAQTLASGRLLTDSEDRALEQVSRSAGADAAWTRGLGDDSLVGKTLSDQLSVNQRQQVMQQGQNYLTQALQNATGTLMDAPQKAHLGSQIAAAPAQTYTDIANTQQQILNQYTTMSPEAALSSYVQQRQAQAQMDYNTKLANANFQENYTQRGIDIAASNVQAMNNYRQAILTDQAQTASAESHAKQLEMLGWALQEKLINDERYQQLVEQIANGGYVDFEALGKAKYGDDWSFMDHYNEAHGIRTHDPNNDKKEPQYISTPPENVNQTGDTYGNMNGTSNTVTINGQQYPSGTIPKIATNTAATPDEANSFGTPTTDSQGNTIRTFREQPTATGNMDGHAVLHDSNIYKPGYSTQLIVQQDGTITIPEPNYEYSNSAYYSLIDSLSHLSPTTLSQINDMLYSVNNYSNQSSYRSLSPNAETYYRPTTVKENNNGNK